MGLEGLQLHMDDFYPRSPCGERRGCFARCRYWAYFYPRSPCGERPMMLSMGAILILFLSTLSLRRATCCPRNEKNQNNISIHALLAESDFIHAQNFCVCIIFLSTLSLRRATLVYLALIRYLIISIHALLAESDAMLNA